MEASTGRELLGAASRRGRDRDPEDDLDPVTTKVAPGKQSAEDRDERPRSTSIPGKLSRWEAGRVEMTPSAAIDYAAGLLHRSVHIDRRAEHDGDIGDGLLSTAFTFIDESRSGQPLPDALARRLSEELGVDLSAVRVHTDDRAARAAATLSARAFTIGNDIYFAEGAYAPASPSGIELIAHEVAHVAQQRGGTPTGERRVSRSDDRHEVDAEAFGRRFADGYGRSEGDPAATVNRMRAEGARTKLPFLDELEQHFGTSFDGIEAYSGEAAQKACQLMAAGAFAVRNIVALADPSPQRELLMHELAHIVQMGNRPAPKHFAFGSLSVGAAGSAVERDADEAIGRGAVTMTADPNVIHRAGGGTTGDGTTGTTPPPEQTLADRKKQVTDFLATLKWRGTGEDSAPVFVDPANTTTYYVTTSESFFKFDDYRTWLRKDPAKAQLTEAQIAPDLSAVHAAGHPELVRVGSDGQRWGRISAGEPHPKIVQLHAEAVAGSKATVGQRYEVYCNALKHCVSLTPKPSVTFKASKTVKATWTTTTGAQPVGEGDLDTARDAIRTAVVACKAYALKNNEWKQYFTEVVDAPDKFPQKMVGDMFEQIAANDLSKLGAKQVGVVFARDPAIPELDTQSKYIGDGLMIEGTTLKVMEMKTGPLNPGAVDGDSKFIEKAQAYAVIVQKGVHATDIKGVSQKGPFDKCVYVFVTQDMAKAWAPKLKDVFTTYRVLNKLVVYPDPQVAGVATLKFNPTFQVPIQDPAASAHHLMNPAIIHPGIDFKKVDITTKGKGSMGVVGGSVTMDMDLAGGVKAKGVTKQITGGADAGTVENKLDGLTTSLDKIFPRVKASAALLDNGVQASLKLTAGPSGIPNINLRESTVTVKYTAGGALAVDGDINIAHTNGKISGKVKVSWAAGQWNFEGTATVSEGMVDGLSEFTARVVYEGGNWSFGVDRAAYKKKLKAVTLSGTALGVMYDTKKGTFSGLVNLDADFGMFGKGSASATIKDNKLSKAEFSYDTPELKYPANSSSPTFTGTVGGTVTYENEKFSGKIRGTAELNVPVLKKLGNPEGNGLAVNVEIGPDGSYSGTIATTKPIMFGKHFKISSLSATLEKDGSVNAAFGIEVVKFKYLDEAKVACAIDKNGFRVTSAKFSKQFGDPSKDRISGGISLDYSEGVGLTIGGNMAVEIKKGFVAKGAFTYNFQTEKLNASLSTEDIDLIKMTPVSKTLFEISRKIPIINVYGVGVYIDIGFDLSFSMDFNLKMRPKVELEEMSLDTFDYKSLSATVELIGAMIASLTGTPKAGLGVFVLSPDLLSGGGGVKVPITGKMEIKPSGTFTLKYSPGGGVEGGAKLGFALTFGITGAVRPYAELSVLKDMWNPKWEGEPLTSFVLMKPRDLLNLTIDLGGDMSKPKDVKPPEKDAAPLASEPKGDRPFKNNPKDGEKDTPVEKPPQATAVPGDPGKDSPAFSMDTLLSQLKGFGPVKALEKILKVARETWDKIKGALGAIVKLFKNWFHSAVDKIEAMLHGIAEKGLVGYLGDVVRSLAGDTVYQIVKPMFDRFATVEDKLMAILEVPPPTSIGEAVDWVWNLIKKLFGLGFSGLGALVGGIRDVAGNLAGQMGNLLTLSVNGAKLGVKRHEYYIGLFGIGPHWLAATEYKIHLPGLSIDHGESRVMNPTDAPGLILFELFEDFHVPHNGDPNKDRWR